MTGSVQPHDGGLIQALRAIGRRMRRVADLRAGGCAICAALAVIVAASWLDLAAELSPAARWCALATAAAASAAVLTAMAASAWALSKPRRVADLADRMAGTGGEVRAGLELLRAGQAREALTEGLRNIAVRRAGSVALSISAPVAAPLRAAMRPFAYFLAGAVIVGILAVAAPRLVKTQFARMLTPWADVPPYSQYEFSVTPGDTKALYGDTVDVTVRFGDAAPEQLELVVQPDAGAAEVLPMFAQGDGAWRARLRDLVSPVRYTVRAPGGRTRAYRVDIIYTPELTKLTFRITPPEYTGLAAWEGGLPERGLAGLAGTKIECTAESNRPLSAGDVRLDWQSTDAQLIALTPAAPGARSVKGSFVIKDAGRLSVGVTDTDGLAGRTRTSGVLTRLDDGKPFVRIARPLPTSFATPTAILPVTVDADDDFGLRQVSLYRSLNESRDLPLDLLDKSTRTAEASAEVHLPLAAYGLEPNDVLTFYARALDNDPASPKGAESEIVRVVIISQEDFDRLTQARASLQEMLTKYQAQERALEALRERLKEDIAKARELDPASKEAADALSKELGDLSEALARQAASADKSASEPPLFDVDKSLSQALDGLAKQLAEASRKVGEAGKAGPGSACVTDLEEAARMLGEGSQQYAEDAMAPLDALQKGYPLIEDAAKFTELYLRQKDLARRMKTLNVPKDKATVEDKVRMADLSDEQAQIQRDLATLLEDIRAHEMTLPDEEPYRNLKTSARQFAEALSASDADAEMQAVGAGLSRLEGAEAGGHAANAERILSEFVARCNEMGKEGESCLAFQPKLQSGLGNTVAQLLAAAGLGMSPGYSEGMGPAGRGGYSMRSSTLDNVGLYGSTEAQEQSSGGGGSADTTAPTISLDTAPRRGAADGVAAGRGDRATGGASLQSVPPEYKKRVEDYFRRVGEETSPRRR